MVVRLTLEQYVARQQLFFAKLQVEAGDVVSTLHIARQWKRVACTQDFGPVSAT